MIKKYSINDLGLIERINHDFFNREITSEDVAKAMEEAKLRKSTTGIHPVCGVMRDSSICLDDTDFNDRAVYRAGFINEIMIRFKRDENGNVIARIPAPYPRLYRHRRNNDSFCGYFLLDVSFNVCSFKESDFVLLKHGFSAQQIFDKQHRLQNVYSSKEHGPIKPDDVVSLYHILKHIPY